MLLEIKIRMVKPKDRLGRTGEIMAGMLFAALTMLFVLTLKDYIATHLQAWNIIGIDSTVFLLAILAIVICILGYFGIIKEKRTI